MAATVAIIGAGAAGLCTAKAAKECGLNPTVLEKGSSIGGVWTKEGLIWDSMHTNVSYFLLTFSDFNWKANIQDFPNRTELNEYLCAYASAFQLHEYIRLNS